MGIEPDTYEIKSQLYKDAVKCIEKSATKKEYCGCMDKLGYPFYPDIHKNIFIKEREDNGKSKDNKIS